MGLIEDLMAQGGNIAELIRKNPAIVSAAMSLLSSRQGSIGPQEGLAGLIGAFGNKGLGDLMSSWISTGANRSVNAGQIADVLGSDALAQFGQQAGIPAGDAGSALASLLPALINGLTPRGEAPPQASLEGTLGSLLGAFGMGR